MTAAATDTPAPDAVRSSGRWVFITGVTLLVLWVLVPIWLLLVNALSAPEEVTAFPKSLIPSFDTALKRLTENLEGFDADAVRYDDVARAGVLSAAAAPS